MVRIIHTADLHLDHGFTSGSLPYNILKQRQQDLLDTFDRIVAIANKERADLLLISGDLFEFRYVKKETVEHINRKFCELENTYVFILPGNHDPYHYFHYYKSFPWGDNIHIFTDEYDEYNLKNLNTVVHGIGFGYQEEKKPILEKIRCQPSEEIHILMLHGSDMSLSPSKESKYIPFDQNDLLDSGFDYIALGHYHQQQLFQDDFGNTIAAYPGSPEPMGFDETGQHGIIIGQLSKEYNDIAFHPISRRECFTLDVDISKCSSLNGIRKEILSRISPFHPMMNLFYITLTGSYSWAMGESIRILEDEFRKEAFYIQLKNQTTLIYDIDSILSENSLLSSYIIEIQSKLDVENDIEKRRILRKAIDMGIEAFKGGRYKV